MTSTPLPLKGHAVVDGICICGVALDDCSVEQVHAHYYRSNNSDIVVCRNDGAPLIMDFSVRQKEWRCPDCGEFYEFLSVATVPITHALALKYVRSFATEVKT